MLHLLAGTPAAIAAPAIGTGILARVGELPRGDWHLGAVFFPCAGLQSVAWWLARRRLAQNAVAVVAEGTTT